MRGLHIERESDEPGATTIIAVHGFGGNGNDTWTPLSSSIWGYIEWFNKQEVTVALYSYPLVNEITNFITREGLKHEAIRLLKAILTLQRAKRSRLLFMGHDIGGTLIKEALVQSAFGDANFRDIYWSTCCLLFIGCPHSFESSSSLEKSIGRLFKSKQLPESQLVNASMASFICQVNQDFADTGVQFFALVYNISSNNEIDDDRVFEPSEADMTFISALEHTQSYTSLSHSDMAWRMFIETRQAFTHRGFDGNKLQPSRKIVLLSSPRQSPRWETMHMETLIQSPKFQEWDSSYGPSFLAIQNVPDAANTSADLRRAYTINKSFAENGEKRFVQFFHFRDDDCRYASVQSMLFTFLAEIYCKFINILDKWPEMRQPDKKYNLLSLESKFRMVQDILSESECPGVLWVLVNFKQNLPGAQWLLDTFSGLATSIEMRIKVLFVNSTHIPLSSSYFKTLDNPTNILIGQSSSTENAFSEQAKLFLERPIMESIIRNPWPHSLQPKIASLLRRARSDSELHRVLVEWLSFSNPNVVMSILDWRDLEDTSIQSQVFSYVLKSRSPILQPESALKLLQLVTLSFRPLTVAELRSLSMCSVATNDCISSLLPGVLMTHGSEARLSHRHLRDFILFSAQSETGLDIEESQKKAHGQIADLCLNSILSSRSQLFLEHSSLGQLEEQAGPESRLDFIHYACNYWPLHARKAHGEFAIKSVALQAFLEDDPLLMRWARAHSLFSKTLSCLDLKDIGPLAIFAQYGLESILKIAMEKHTNASWYGRDCSSAIVTAAARGESNMVRFLLGSVTHEKEFLERALFAAFSVENEEAFQLLLVSLHELSPTLDQVSGLFREVPPSDRDELMHRLCIEWKYLNGEFQPDRSLIGTSFIEGSLETVKCLLKHENQQPDSNKYLDWLSLLSKHNFVDTSVFLLGEILQAFDRNENPDLDRATREQLMEAQQKHVASIQDVLRDAIKYGQHKLLSSLLAVLQRHSIQPRPIQDLFHTAIDHGRKACLGCLFDHYGQEIDIPDIRSRIISKGTGAMLQITFSIGNELDNDTFSHLIQEVGYGEKYDPSMLQALLKEGQKQKSLELYTNTVTDLLAHAVDTNKTGLAKLLIRAGTDLEKKTLVDGSRTPLYHAVYKGYVAITAALIEANANPRTIDESAGWEAIHAAYDNASILRILLKSNTDINAKTTSCSTVLMFAVRWQHEDSVKELLMHQPDLHCTDKKSTLLSLCVENSSNKIASMLLVAGMDPCNKHVISINKFQLHICVKKNNIELLERLLLYNLPIDEKREHGNTPLHCLTDETDVEICRLLLNRGASVNAENYLRETPLTAAAKSNNVQVAEFLLLRGARAGSRNCQNCTPLYFACHNSSLEMVKLLIDEGAHQYEAQGTTLFQTVCLGQGSREQKSAVLTYLLEEAKVDPLQTTQRWGSNLGVACLTMDRKTIERLIDRSVPVNEGDPVGRRPVHFALHKSLELVQYLVDQGADLGQKDMLDRNALHFAVISGRLDLVQYIVEKQPAMVNEPDCDGWTPIFWAARKYPRWVTESSERRKIIKYLKAQGADIMIQAEGVDRKWTPYELSRYYSLDENVVKLLQPKRKHLKGHKDKLLWEYILSTSQNEFQKGREYVDNGNCCDTCLVTPIGVYYECMQCWGLLLCFKCYRSRHIVHPGHDLYKHDKDPANGANYSTHNSGTLSHSGDSESGYESSGVGVDGSRSQEMDPVEGFADEKNT